MTAPLDQETERLLALLESQHEFPGTYTFKVIYRTDEAVSEGIVDVIRAQTGLEPVSGTDQQRTSSGGNFASMSLEIHVEQAKDVLAVYAVLANLDPVISYF